MLDAIDDIETFVRPGRAEFFSSELIQSAVLYKLGSLGESAKGVPTPFRDAHAGIRWKGITGIRDVVNHKYHDIDLDIIWTAIERDLPELKAQLLDLIATDAGLAE